jgi:hypothetical protein
MSIYATLHTGPSHVPAHEVIYITRGATAELTYPLYDKVFRFQDVDQITFTFKQGKTLYWYSMFTYVVPSEDTTVQSNKQYYTITPKIPDALQCTITKVATPSGNPKESNYFEISTDPTLNWKTTNYVVDPHFYHFDNAEYEAIVFNLDSEETKQFKSGLPLEHEIALKLNTDSFANLGGKDSIIIEPQHYIEVCNSLFSCV